MDWVIKQLSVKKNFRIKHADVNNYNAEYKRLKFCEGCSRSWERLTTGSMASYSHLPTYGLHRKTCDFCKGERNKTYRKRSTKK